jgi:hypothetical protein
LTEDFLSGTSGQVGGIRGTTRAVLADARDDGLAWARLLPPRLRRAARTLPRRRVLALSVVHDDRPTLSAAAGAELATSRHQVQLAQIPVGGRGKFENLNELLRRHPVDAVDWLLVLDDDVRLPRGFLDSFLFLAERFDLALAQPAHRRRSHAAWPVTRRRAGAVVRETRFVEIGPVFAFHRRTFETLLPFPPLRYGWGLDVHWSALATQQGWRLGIVDATPVTHGIRQIATGYGRDEAVAEARSFLTGRPYVPREQALQSVTEHRNWRY